MAFIAKAITANDLGSGLAFVGAPRAGNFTSSSYKVAEAGFTPASGNLDYLNTRFDDPRYYVGDTPN